MSKPREEACMACFLYMVATGTLALDREQWRQLAEWQCGGAAAILRCVVQAIWRTKQMVTTEPLGV